MSTRTPTAFAVCFLVALLALQGAESSRILNKIKSAGDFRLRQVNSGSSNVVSAMSTPQTTSYSKSNLAMTMDSAVDTGSSQAALGPKDYAILHPSIIKDEVKAIKLSPPPFIPPEPESSMGSQSEPPFEPPRVPKPAPQVQTPKAALPQTGSSQTPCADVACIGSKITRIVSSFDAEEKAAEIQAQQLREFQRAIATVPKGFANELKDAKSSLDRAATLRAATDQFVQGATQRLFNIIRKADKVKCASLNVAKSALKQVVIAIPKAATVLHPIHLESLPPSAPAAAPAPASAASSFRFRSVSTPSDLVFHVRQDRTPVLASADDAANEEFSAFAAAFPAAAASDADCEN